MKQQLSDDIEEELILIRDEIRFSKDDLRQAKKIGAPVDPIKRDIKQFEGEVEKLTKLQDTIKSHKC